MALAALQKALAEEPARAERDLGLQDVVAGAERVAVRIEERINPVLLVIAQKMPDPGQSGRRGDRRQQEEPQAHPGDEEQDRAAHQQHDRRAEIGLLEDQRSRHDNHRSAGRIK